MGSLLRLSERLRDVFRIMIFFEDKTLEEHYKNIKSWSKVIPIFKKDANGRQVHVCTYVIYSEKEFIENNPILIQERAILTAVHNGYDIGDMQSNKRPRFKHHDNLALLDMSLMCHVFNNYYWKETIFKFCDFKGVKFQRWNSVKYDFDTYTDTTFFRDYNYSRFINCEFSTDKSDVINIFRQGCYLKDCFIKHEGVMYFVSSKDSLLFVEPPSEIVAYALFIKTDKGVRISIEGRPFATRSEFLSKHRHWDSLTEIREQAIMAAAFDCAEKTFRAIEIYTVSFKDVWFLAKEVWDLIKKQTAKALKNSKFYRNYIKKKELVVPPAYFYKNNLPVIPEFSKLDVGCEDTGREIKTVLDDISDGCSKIGKLLKIVLKTDTKHSNDGFPINPTKGSFHFCEEDEFSYVWSGASWVKCELFNSVLNNSNKDTDEDLVRMQETPKFGMVPVINPTGYELPLSQRISSIYRVPCLPIIGKLGDIYVIETPEEQHFWTWVNGRWKEIIPSQGTCDGMTGFVKVYKEAYDSIVGYKPYNEYEEPYSRQPRFEVTMTDLSRLIRMPIPSQSGINISELRERIWQAIEFLRMIDHSIIMRHKFSEKLDWSDIGITSDISGNLILRTAYTDNWTLALDVAPAIESLCKQGFTVGENDVIIKNVATGKYVWLTKKITGERLGPRVAYAAGTVIASGLILPEQAYRNMVFSCIAKKEITVIETDRSENLYGCVTPEGHYGNPLYWSFDETTWDAMAKSSVEKNRLKAYFYDSRFHLLQKQPDDDLPISTVPSGQATMTLEEYMDEGFAHRLRAKAALRPLTLADQLSAGERFLRTSKDVHYRNKARQNELRKKKNKR